MAIEWVWFFNAGMDYLLLWVCGRLTFRAASWKRLFFAAALGGWAAAAAVCPAWTFLQHPLCALALEPLLLVLAFGFLPAGRFARLWGTFTGLCFLCGGVGHILCALGFAGAFSSLAAAVGLCVCGFGKPIPVPRNFRACLRVASMDFPALLDSGNTLREPVSGLPVAVGSARLFACCDPHLCRKVTVRTALGSRLCPVFGLTGAVLDYSGGRTAIALLWVLVQEEPLPGGIDVILAPCICWEEYDDYDMDLRSA